MNFLNDDHYPIRIDPTIEITQSSGSGAIEDVTLNSNGGSSGSSGSIYVGNRSSYGISRTLMRFPGLDLSNVPNAIAIAEATDSLRDIMCETTQMNVHCHPYDGSGSWQESTVTWNTASPNLYGDELDCFPVSYDIGSDITPTFTYSFNITNAVKQWKNCPLKQSQGIIFKADDSLEGSSTYVSKTFASYNRATNKPVLTVQYEEHYFIYHGGCNGTCGSLILPIGTSIQLSIFSDDPDVDDVLLMWNSDKASAVAVDEYGEVTAVGFGVAEISVSSSLEYEDTIKVYVVGTGYIRNRQTTLAMTVNDSNTTVTAQRYYGCSKTQWVIEYGRGGYFTIRTANAPNNYEYLGVNSNKRITLTEGYPTNRKQWRIFATQDGGCKIIPRKYPNDVVKTNESEDATALSVGTYVPDTTYVCDWQDEWVLVPINSGYGAQIFRPLSSESNNLYNCMCYALMLLEKSMIRFPGTDSDGLIDQWEHPTNYLYRAYKFLEDSYDPITNDLTEEIRNEIDSSILRDFNYWYTYFSDELDFSLVREENFGGNGCNTLNDNQYRIVLRVGAHVSYIDDDGDPSTPEEIFRWYDYHFWYQTFNGRWANKNGFDGVPVYLDEGITPSTANSTGWDFQPNNYNYVDFYDGTIFSFIVTLN